jgi:flavin-dependent dehydrogenase
MTQTYDAIVIGAGVMGASLAFHLAERGLKPAILERKVTASGASLVELILDGAPKTVDITPFRFERFAEGKLIEGEYGYGHIWK